MPTKTTNEWWGTAIQKQMLAKLHAQARSLWGREESEAILRLQAGKMFDIHELHRLWPDELSRLLNWLNEEQIAFNDLLNEASPEEIRSG